MSRKRNQQLRNSILTQQSLLLTIAHRGIDTTEQQIGKLIHITNLQQITEKPSLRSSNTPWPGEFYDTDLERW